MTHEIVITGTKNGLLFTKGNGSQFVSKRGVDAWSTFLEVAAVKEELGDDGIKDGRKIKVTITIEDIN